MDITDEHKSLIMDSIREHVPPNMHKMVFDDIVSKIKRYESKGYRLPKGYDASKHDLDDNEIVHYEQVVERDRDREKQKVEEMLNFTAWSINMFCKAMNVDMLKTSKLESLVSTSIKKGDFADCTEGVGEVIRGTVLDNPVLSTVLKFAKHISQAHTEELEELEDRKAKEEDEQEKRKHTSSLGRLNATTMFNDLPAPPGASSKVESKKK